MFIEMEKVQMRQKFIRFMQGRNGFDQFSQFLNIVVVVLFVISLFTKWKKLYTIGLGVMAYMYFRVFSKNISKRYMENQKFCNLRYDVSIKWNKMKKEWEQRKIYRFYHCPICSQKVRVPKGRGKICITCPKCRSEFIKKS